MQVGLGERVELLEGVLDAALLAVARRHQVVADQQDPVAVDAGHELVELQGQQPALGAELDDVVLDLAADAADHLGALGDDADVAHRDEVLDLQGGQGAADLVEP